MENSKFTSGNGGCRFQGIDSSAGRFTADEPSYGFVVE